MPRRIPKLADKFLSLQNPRDHPEELGLQTFTLGALYSLERARKLVYSRATWRPTRMRERHQEIRSHATCIAAAAEPPSDGKWLAEYYFNNSVWRVDVGFERVAKLVGRKNGLSASRLGKTGFGDLTEILRRAGARPTWLASWRQIRKYESNLVKHKSPRSLQSGRMSLRDLTNAVERLIAAVDWALNL